MKKGMLLGGLLALAGCVPSLQPLYTPPDLTYDPALLGTWGRTNEQDRWTFTPDGAKQYRLVYTDKHGRTGRFAAHLVRVAGHRFLDLYPDRPANEWNDLYSVHLVPAHTFLLVTSLAPTLQMAMMDPDWLKKCLEDQPDAVKHERVGEGILLTAQPKDLQAFLLQHLAQAFGSAETLERKSPAAPTRGAPAAPASDAMNCAARGGGAALWLPLLCAGCLTWSPHMENGYIIRRAPAPPSGQGLWDEPAWRDANVLNVDHFVAGRGRAHRPQTRVKLTYTDAGLAVFFRVADRHVLSTHTNFQEAVYQDSCVEFFVQPKPDKGYFNFEMNAGGTLLLTYIEDPARTPAGFKKFTRLPPEADALVQRYHSLPRVVAPERAGPVEWTVEYFIPFRLLEPYVGRLGKISGQTWRGNFFKCADASSQPHWASWAPLDADFTGGFHRPDRFAPLRFE